MQSSRTISRVGNLRASKAIDALYRCVGHRVEWMRSISKESIDARNTLIGTGFSENEEDGTHSNEDRVDYSNSGDDLRMAGIAYKDSHDGDNAKSFADMPSDSESKTAVVGEEVENIQIEKWFRNFDIDKTAEKNPARPHFYSQESLDLSNAIQNRYVKEQSRRHGLRITHRELNAAMLSENPRSALEAFFPKDTVDSLMIYYSAPETELVADA